MRKNTLQPMLDLYIKKGGSKAWTQGCDARDSRWGAVPSYDAEAVAWCLAGALKSWVPYPLESRIELWRRLRKEEGYFTGIINFNDHPSTTWDDVVRVLSQKDASIWERMFGGSKVVELAGAIVAGLLIGAIAGWLLI